jgi:diguanylate cyclase (GGDEF)-like protein
MSQVPPPSILIVDDDPVAVRALAHIVGGIARLRFAANGGDALRLAHDSPPDLVLLDAQMEGMSGFDVCRALKADARLAPAPVLFVTSSSGPEFELQGFETGAADFIAKPVVPALVLARVRAQLRAKAMADQLRTTASTDMLTGLANRHAFDLALDEEWRRVRRRGTPLSLLLLDVDHFKLYNDRHGHPAGDEGLRQVAGTLAESLHRPSDRAFRYGGEEFAMLLPETARPGALRVAERVVAAVATRRIAHAASPTAPHVTVSVGVGCFDDACEGWRPPSADSRLGELGAPARAADLVAAADRALYEAKRAGRARTSLQAVVAADAP